MGSRTKPPSLHDGLAFLSLLVQCLVHPVSAHTAATDGPASYQGLYQNPTGAVETINCGSRSVFALSSTFAGCCSIGGSCNFPTACAGGKPTNRKGDAWTCGPDRACYTMTVYGSYPPAADSWVVHNCANSWSASTIYRSLPSSVMTTGSSSSSSSSTGSSMATTPAPGPGAGLITAAPDPTGAPDDPEPSQSQAWIAGVVVGCLAAGVALSGLGFWLGRRRRRGAGGEETKRGFTLHSAALVRSGEDWHSGENDETERSGPRVQAVTIADGVEMQADLTEKGLLRPGPQELAGAMSAELEAGPIHESTDNAYLKY